jgi:hypothetical protein
VLANRVKETTTTTGTGNITLAGAESGFQSCNSAFGTAGWFVYWIIGGTEWECGYGHLSAATTLVRDKILDNSSDGTTALSFSAGTKTVICTPMEAFSSPLCNPFPYNGDANASIGPLNWTGPGGTTTVVANRLYLIPFLHVYGGAVVSFKNYVLTAVAATKARAGLYRWNPLNGAPDTLVQESTDIDTTTTGMKTTTFTALRLKPGWYWMGFLCSGAISARGFSFNTATAAAMGGTADGLQANAFLYATITAGWTALPATPTITDTVGTADATAPATFLGL